MTDMSEAAGDSPWPQKRIRFARPDELEQLIVLCRELAVENAIGPMKENLVRDLISACVHRKGGFIGVIGDEGRIEGAMCLVFNHLWYNDDLWWVEDKFHFVHPDYRTSNNASELLDWAVWWRRQLQIPLMMGVVSNERTAAKIRLYERKLGPMSGALFLVGAKTGLTSEVQ